MNIEVCKEKTWNLSSTSLELTTFTSYSLVGLFPDYGFGANIAISGDNAIVGSPNSGKYDWSTLTQASGGKGNARIFDLGSNPPIETLLIVDDQVGGQYYGYQVAIDGDTAVVSAWDINSYVPSVFVFGRRYAHAPIIFLL